MTGDTIPIWSLATSADDTGEAVNWDAPEEGFTPESLARLRRVLAVYDDNPPVLLERHAVTMADLPKGGREIAATSPLLKNLVDLVGKTMSVTPAESRKGSDAVLYRTVVSKEVAKLTGSGLAAPKAPTRVKERPASRGSSGPVIDDGTRFVPAALLLGVVAEAVGPDVAELVTPLVSMGPAALPFVVALAATAAIVYAEEQCRMAVERLQSTLDEIKREDLERERDELNGSVSAIAKATSVLADEGRLGHSLGLDSSAHAVDTAVSTAERRVSDWERRLEKLSTAGATPDELKKAFGGIEAEHGEFRTKLRMAMFAIATKRRLAVLQAAEHMQLNADMSLARFSRALERETNELDEIERRITTFLSDLAALDIRVPSRGWGLPYAGFNEGDVRELLSWSPRLRGLAAAESPHAEPDGDVEIAIVVPEKGAARVLAPVAVASSSSGGR